MDTSKYKGDFWNVDASKHRCNFGVEDSLQKRCFFELSTHRSIDITSDLQTISRNYGAMEAELRMRGCGCGVADAGLRVLGSGSRLADAGFRVRVNGPRLADAGFRLRYCGSGLKGPDLQMRGPPPESPEALPNIRSYPLGARQVEFRSAPAKTVSLSTRTR